MLDINKRIEFEDPTVADVVNELKKLPETTLCNFNGYPWGYLHVDEEEKYCCLASEPLDEDYEKESI